MTYGDDERKTFLEALEKTPFIALACKKTGIARATVYRWMSDDINFRISVKQAVHSIHDKLGEAAYSVVQEKVKEKNFTAARFVLTHYPSMYGVKQRDANIREEAEQEDSEDRRNMTKEQRRAASDRAFMKLWGDGNGNVIVSKQMADTLLEEGKIKPEDVIGEIPNDDPVRRTLPKIAANAVRIKGAALRPVPEDPND